MACKDYCAMTTFIAGQLMLYLLGAPCPLNGVIQKNHSLFMWGLADGMTYLSRRLSTQSVAQKYWILGLTIEWPGLTSYISRLWMKLTLPTGIKNGQMS